MKNRRFALVVTLVLLLAGLLAGGAAGQREPSAALAPLGAAFTYQGKLADGVGSPVSGDCDFQFGLWDAAGGGAQVGAICTVSAVAVDGGIFTAHVNVGGEFGASAFTGQARWLEVAVRCPAGGGSYTLLSPRQPLTAAPAALSLALPYHAQAYVGGPLVSFRNSSPDGEAALFGSQGAALWVETAGTEGLRVASAGTDGVLVDSAGGNGVSLGAVGADGVYVHRAGNPTATTPQGFANGLEVAGTEGYGLWVGRADGTGVAVASAGYGGVYVGSAGTNGVRVDSAGGDGVYVHQAGNPSATTAQSFSNGFEVAGAEGYGLWVGRADGVGVAVVSAGYAGLFVGTAGTNGLTVQTAYDDGVHVDYAGNYGMYVDTAIDAGFHVTSGGGRGLEVDYASQGVYVGTAYDAGVYIGSSSGDGVYVDSAGDNGVDVKFAYSDGVRVRSSVWSALYGNTTDERGEWGLYTPDNIYAQNVTSRAWTLIARVIGPEALSPGDVVSAAGVAELQPGDNVPLMLVRPAGAGSSGVVGVVESRMALVQPEDEEFRFQGAAGPARPGDYVALIVFGPARVKVDASEGMVQPGMRLTAAEGGRARMLKTVVVDGVELSEGAATIGVALDAPDKEGFVWVLVNPQ